MQITGEPAASRGRNRAYFETNLPVPVIARWDGEAGWWNRPYETYEKRRPRARMVINQLIRTHGAYQDRVALVSHGGFYNHFMAEVLGLQTAAIETPGLYGWHE